ncbi:MAG: ribosome maturation factor RimM [Flavobacteriales bacterium]|jgi:16S rRNA processing protein RimM
MTAIPDKKDLHAIGYFSKLHGFKGELTAALDTGDIHDYENLEIIFLDIKGTLVPYFVELLEYKTNTAAKVKLEGIDTEEKAKALVKASIYINRSDMSAPDTDRAALRAIEGYRVFDSEHGDIGVIDHIEESANNPLMVIFHGKKEILLPLNSDFFDTIDDEKREVHITAPGGLIDFYLSQ